MRHRDQRFIDPQVTAREQAQAVLRAKHHLLAEDARRAVIRKARAREAASAASRRDRRLVRTGEASWESPWANADPVSTHPDAPLPIEDGFSLEVSERQHRRASRRRGRRARAAYWTVLGDPPNCAPGDLTTAAIFHRRVISAIEQGGWSHNEQTALALLEKTWRARARGEDARFVLVGNRPGRASRKIEARVRELNNREG